MGGILLQDGQQAPLLQGGRREFYGVIAELAYHDGELLPDLPEHAFDARWLLCQRLARGIDLQAHSPQQLADVLHILGDPAHLALVELEEAPGNLRGGSRQHLRGALPSLDDRQSLRQRRAPLLRLQRPPDVVIRTGPQLDQHLAEHPTILLLVLESLRKLISADDTDADQ